MNVYRLKNAFTLEYPDGLKHVKMTNVELIKLIETLITGIKYERAFQNNHLNEFEYLNEMIYEIAKKIPNNKQEEKVALSLVLKFLMDNREAIIGLSNLKGTINIDLVKNQLLATVT